MPNGNEYHSDIVAEALHMATIVTMIESHLYYLTTSNNELSYQQQSRSDNDLLSLHLFALFWSKFSLVHKKVVDVTKITIIFGPNYICYNKMVTRA